MARNRRKGRDVSGVFLLDKHLGDSSNFVLQQIKRLFNANKAGHTGALDPLATGMLPICLGEATKFSHFLLDADKTYEVTAELGKRTTTSDADGEVVAENEVVVSEEQLKAAIETFKGTTEQVPSIYSALKYQGKPYYYYARQGIDIPRKSRPITIYSLEINEFATPYVSLTVRCSKGTYIRSLVDDLGQVLGCGAYVTKLHRTEVANYPQQKMMPFNELAEKISACESEDEKYALLDSHLLPIDSAIAEFPLLQLDGAQVTRLVHGQSVKVSYAASGVGFYRAYDQQQTQFLGLVEVLDTLEVKVKRLVSTADFA